MSYGNYYYVGNKLFYYPEAKYYFNDNYEHYENIYYKTKYVKPQSRKKYNDGIYTINSKDKTNTREKRIMKWDKLSPSVVFNDYKYDCGGLAEQLTCYKLVLDTNSTSDFTIVDKYIDSLYCFYDNYRKLALLNVKVKQNTLIEEINEYMRSYDRVIIKLQKCLQICDEHCNVLYCKTHKYVDIAKDTIQTMFFKEKSAVSLLAVFDNIDTWNLRFDKNLGSIDLSYNF